MTSENDAPPLEPPAAVSDMPSKPKRKQSAKSQKSKSHWVRRGVRLVVLVLCALALAVLLGIVVFRVVNPVITPVMAVTKLKGETLRRDWVPLEAISPNLRLAVISSEDGQYCNHYGVDWGAVREALKEAADGGEPRGASTIPMQTVKNLFLWPNRSYVRKALEVPLAYIASAVWGKRRTMEIYLNVVEWGPGVFGAQAAARYHFGKDASQLTRHEAALMAASLPNPNVRTAGRPGPLTRKIGAAVERRMPAMEARAACVMP
ncbi:monofunctional biosynthetic peptidoglycan transglycosylase [Methyloligella sp. 2.7D]|uniref:monofunctional biosynthetic peptidoglycan transglycosylase n=1 Tax=unclassified Methyloligella TaxID=2625955 RepID=UPI00157D3894|nr:monofunctional biosynthetic peptidoglycan transglycosylase [Methyloligella sp. GL2]QKP76455.1 monofunctional biosynthetic peptidoglycan transglycosylase [Methyloligella sp. GL2]